MATPMKGIGDRTGAGSNTLRGVVNAVEGSLGWTPRPPKGKTACTGLDRERAMNLEVSKLRREIAKNPALYTIPNLHLALAWCWKKRLQVTSPVALIYHVETALSEAAAPEPQLHILERKRLAIEFEKNHGDEHSERWLRRLTRAQGAGLTDILDQWGAARGG